MTTTLLYQKKKIFVRSIGSGKPVILIHGFGEDGEVWNKQVEFLKDRFHLIVPDLPGSGKSEMIDDMSMEGMAELMKWILAYPNRSAGGTLDPGKSKRTTAISDSENPFLEGREAARLGFGGTVMIGHSMGGYITLAFAEKYPEDLSAFGLFHSSAFADNEEKKAARRKSIEFILQNGAFEFLQTAIPNLFADDSKQKIPVAIKELVNKGGNFSDSALVSYYEAMIRRPDRTKVLQEAPVPVLFIMGKYDKAVPMADTLQQCHLPEKSYIHILRKSGHMGMVEEPETSNLILDKFLLEIRT